MVEEIVLSRQEQRFLSFLPPAPGGIQPPAEVLSSLVNKRLAATGPDGRLWLTVLGDRVRLGQIPRRIAD